MYGIKIENNTLTILEGDANYLLDNKVYITNIRETKEQIQYKKELLENQAKRLGKFVEYDISKISRVVYGAKIENNQVVIEKADANTLLDKGYSIFNMCDTERNIKIKEISLRQLCTKN